MSGSLLVAAILSGSRRKHTKEGATCAWVLGDGGADEHLHPVEFVVVEGRRPAVGQLGSSLTEVVACR